MLANSAHKAGIEVYALDRFADADTQALCRKALKIPTRREGFDIPSLLRAIETLDPKRVLPILIGSGLDGNASVIETIGRKRPLMGNTARLFRLYKNPVRFFRLLNEGKIAYPEVSFTCPESPEGWLMKFGCSEGGKGVCLPGKTQQRGRKYFQRRIASPGYSALFLANGTDFSIIGFNQLEQISNTKRPFLFQGARNGAQMEQDQIRQITKSLTYLVQKTGFKGLGSLDFVLDEKGFPQTLEINPRPSATLGLFDASFKEGLVKAHIDACEGKSLPPSQELVEFKAFRVILATKELRISPAFEWPVWSTDQPIDGSVIQAGEPLCTIHADAKDGLTLENRLNQREAEIILRLGRQP